MKSKLNTIMSSSKVFWYFLKGHQKNIVFLLAVYLTYTALEMIYVLSITPLVGALTGKSTFIPLSGLLGIVSYFLSIIPVSNILIKTCFLMGSVQIAKSLISIIFESYTGKLTSEIMYSIRSNIFDRFKNSKYDFFLERKAGELIYFAHNAPDKPATAIGFILEGLVETLKTVGILFVLFSLNWKITVIILILGLIFGKLNSFFAKNVSYLTGKGRIQFSNQSLVSIQEFLSGIKLIKVFNVSDFWGNKYKDANLNFSKLYAKDAKWFSVSTKLFEMIGLGGTVILIGVFELIYPNQLQEHLPVLASFIFGMLRLAPSVSAIGRARMNMTSRLPDAEKLYQFFMEPISKEIDGKNELQQFSKSIKFENVEFVYNGRNQTLNKLNLEIEKGKATAIVGASGAGKTTLLNLMFRLYRVTSGKILIDDKNINDINLADWLKQVGYVSQDTFIFHGTISENLIFGRHNITKQDIVDACQAADIHSFIESLPEKYETVVGEKGMKLSGGQQQRLAIARSLVTRPQIIVFDEATSSLDSISEEQIQKTINSLARTRTLIMIAHRISTIKDADIIYVLRNGEIIQRGNYKSLIDSEGEFQRLYQKSPEVN